MLKVFPRLQNTAQISKWPLGKSVRTAEHFPFNPIEQQQFQGFGSQVNKQNKVKLPPPKAIYPLTKKNFMCLICSRVMT